MIATNLVLSDANAYLSDSTVTATDNATEAGVISIEATNTSTINAVNDTETKVEGGGNSVGVGVNLAFNTVGMKSQNFLFNTIDALLGTNIGDEDPAQTRAYVSNSDLDSGAGVHVESKSEATINAEVKNASVTTSPSLKQSTAVSVGAVISLNRISADVAAFIDKSANLSSVTGNISVLATGRADIDSEVKASSMAIAGSLNASKGISVGASIARNDVRNDVQAYLRGLGTIASPVDPRDGSFTVTATELSNINSSSVATSIAVAAGKQATGFSGGGAGANNQIMGGANAFIDESYLGDGQLDGVAVNADSSATINSVVKAASGSVSLGATQKVKEPRSALP